MLMPLFLTIGYIIACIWALVRLWRSSFSTKAKVSWSVVITLLPFGAFLSLVNKPDAIRRLKYTVAAYAVLVVSFAGVYAAGFRWYRISSVSMQPTISRGEYVIGRLNPAYAKNVKRFDIVIYRRQDEPGGIFTSRVVGLPGDHVVIHANVISVDGQPVRLLSTKNYPGPKELDIHLAANAFFVLGDNEKQSVDSRMFGPVALTDLAGYLVFKK